MSSTPTTPGTPTDQKKKRHRGQQACVECHRKKSKCYGGMPCSRCSVNGLECIFKENPKKRPAVGGGTGGKIKATTTAAHHPMPTTNTSITPAAAPFTTPVIPPRSKPK